MTSQLHHLHHARRRRVVLWSVVAGVLLASIGGVAWAVPSQRPPDPGTVILGTGSFSLSGKLVGAPLSIGTSSVLLVTVKNPSRSAMRVTALSGRAVSIFSKNCQGAWIQVRRYAASAALGAYVPARGQRSIRLTVRLVNMPAVNQDACKGVKVPLVLSGQGVVLP